MRGSDDVTGNYKFTDSVDGTLTVTPRVVVIESEGGRRVYNGQPLTNPTYKFTTGSFVDGEVSEVKTTGTITEVGSVDNTIVYTTTDKFDANNYDITLTPGKLEITLVTDEVVVTITENSGSAKYDGTEKTVTGYKVTSISDPLYKESDFNFSGDATIKGTDAGTYDMNLAPEDFKNINGNFKNVRFVIYDGTLVISPRTLTITSGSDSKEYDGTPLTSSEIKVSGDGFVDGEGASYTFTGSQLDVGSSKNSFDYRLNDNTKAKNYEITKEYGDLTVTAVSTQIVITANSKTEVYSGQAVTDSNYTYTGKLAEGDKLEVEVVGSQTDKGSSDNVVKSYKVTRDGVDVTNNYTFGASQKGTLTVTPRPVTLTSGGGEKEYDGTPLTNSTVTVGGSGFVAGEGATYNVTGSQTDKGSSKNWFTYTLAEGTKADNYTITQEYGELVVTKNTSVINITAKSANKTYDGQALTETRYDFTQNILAEGDVLTAVVEGSQTDAGSSANVVKSYKVMRGDVDVTDFYTFGEIENGTLTVTERKVTLTSESADKPYDGTPLTRPDVTVSDEGFVDGEVSDIKAIGTITDKGSVPNTITFTEGENFKASNYIIVRETGTLTITADATEVVVYISGNTGTEKYDGTEKTVTGYDAVSSNPLYTANDYSFSGDATVKSTNAGSYDMELAPEDFKNTSANFTNVTFIIVDGKLNIAQRKVLMTSADDEKVYDGTPLTNSTVTVTGDGFAEGEGAAYTVTGNQLDEGSSNNSFTYELNEGTLAANYIIETKEGELTVKPILTEITITANSGEKMYDGSALINGGYTFTSGILVDGDVLTAVVEGSQLNAGSSANVVKSYRVMRSETDVTANYRFAESVDGKLTVTARKVVMTSADDEKVYDGTPLTNDEITVTGDGFIEGEGVTYDVTGSQLDVGSSDNSFTYELNEGTLAENYIIETEEGKLTVTSPEQHIVITANSAEKTYDGTPLTDDGFTYTDFVLAEGDVLEAVVEGSQTDAGSSVNVIKSYRVMRGDEDVTANYIFDDSVDGTLTVTKRKVTLTSGTACKIYDGKYLTCNKVEVGGDGFVEGEGATYDVTGKRKDIGWSYNDFTYKLNDNTKADNYEITVERGFLYVKDQAEKPKTGDSSDLLLLLALMSMSGAGAAGTVYLYRRKREEQE